MYPSSMSKHCEMSREKFHQWKFLLLCPPTASRELQGPADVRQAGKRPSCFLCIRSPCRVHQITGRCKETSSNTLISSCSTFPAVSKVSQDSASLRRAGTRTCACSSAHMTDLVVESSLLFVCSRQSFYAMMRAKGLVSFSSSS